MSVLLILLNLFVKIVINFQGKMVHFFPQKQGAEKGSLIILIHIQIKLQTETVCVP